MVLRWCLSAALLVAACSGSDDAPALGGSGSGPLGTGVGETIADSGDDGDGGDGDCGTVSDESANESAPVDIMIVVDNSGSMDVEMVAVQESLNDFSQSIINADIDVRVILVSNYAICVPPPLGSGGCPEDDNNQPLYTHINFPVASNDALQIIAFNTDVIEVYDQVMRENSIKHIVVVSDDNSVLDAEGFNDVFTALGSKYEDYKFHALVSSAPPDSGVCEGISAATGQVYIDLAEATGGVFGDLCAQDFTPVFDEIAISVEQSTPVACEWEIPTPPPGEVLDPDLVEVELTLDGLSESLAALDSEDECGQGEGWFFEPNNLMPTTIRVCPATCLRVQSASDAKVEIILVCQAPPDPTG